MSHPVITAAEAPLGTPLLYEGELALLDRPRRVLLVSRVERRPLPDAGWMLDMQAALRHGVSGGEVLVGGVDRTPFEAALLTCRRLGGAAVVALEEPLAAYDSLRALLPERHLLVWPARRWEKDSPAMRDRLMGCLADRAYEIRVRAGGNMQTIAEELRARECAIERWDVVPPLVRVLEPSDRLEWSSRTATRGQDTPSTNGFLTHFTREPDGAWPAEERTAYIDWLCSGVQYEPRDGFAALCRILSEKRIRGGGELIPGAEPMVCFTSLPPEAAVKLRRWRKGLVRWSFSKYGLAIRQAALERLGARAVRYLARSELKALPVEERQFAQLERSEKIDWSAEAEWRVRGDVELSKFKRGDVVALVASENEMQQVADRFGIAARVLPLSP